MPEAEVYDVISASLPGSWARTASPSWPPRLRRRPTPDTRWPTSSINQRPSVAWLRDKVLRTATRVPGVMAALVRRIGAPTPLGPGCLPAQRASDPRDTMHESAAQAWEGFGARFLTIRPGTSMVERDELGDPAGQLWDAMVTHGVNHLVVRPDRYVYAATQHGQKSACRCSLSSNTRNALRCARSTVLLASGRRREPPCPLLSPRRISPPTSLLMHGDDDQIVPYADAGPLSAGLLANGTLKPTRASRTACQPRTPTPSTPILTILRGYGSALTSSLRGDVFGADVMSA